MRVLATLVSMGRGVPRYVAALLLAVFLISGTVWAVEVGEGQYRIWGSGNSSCGEWTSSKEKSDQGRYWQLSDWMLGYLTAYGLWVEIGTGAVTRTDDFGGLLVDFGVPTLPVRRWLLSNVRPEPSMYPTILFLLSRSVNISPAMTL